MQNKKLSEDEVQRFIQGCEDLMRLGSKFTAGIRQALSELKSTYEPALNSQYVEKAVVELLTKSLQDFERKVESNLEGIDKVCTKGGKWFPYYLGRAVEQGPPGQAGSTGRPAELPAFDTARERESAQLTIFPLPTAKKAGG
jgi:hypothetical protein